MELFNSLTQPSCPNVQARLSGGSLPGGIAPAALRDGPSAAQQPVAAAPAIAATGGGAPSSGASAAYQQLVLSHVKQLLDCAESIGGEVGRTQTGHALRLQRACLRLAMGP